jgi:hypothetical protein
MWQKGKKKKKKTKLNSLNTIEIKGIFRTIPFTAASKN